MNATLLEIFLALTFLVLGFAVLQQAKAGDATVRADSLQAAAEQHSSKFDSLLEELQNNERLVADLRDSINILVPPTCDEGAPLVRVWVGAESISIRALRDHRALRSLANQQWAGPIDALVSAFRQVGEDGYERRCRYIAEIHRSGSVGLEKYLAAMRAVSANFRTRGAFGSGSD